MHYWLLVFTLLFFGFLIWHNDSCFDPFFYTSFLTKFYRSLHSKAAPSLATFNKNIFISFQLEISTLLILLLLTVPSTVMNQVNFNTDSFIQEAQSHTNTLSPNYVQHFNPYLVPPQVGQNGFYGGAAYMRQVPQEVLNRRLQLANTNQQVLGQTNQFYLLKQQNPQLYNQALPHAPPEVQQQLVSMISSGRKHQELRDKQRLRGQQLQGQFTFPENRPPNMNNVDDILKFQACSQLGLVPPHLVAGTTQYLSRSSQNISHYQRMEELPVALPTHHTMLKPGDKNYKIQWLPLNESLSTFHKLADLSPPHTFSPTLMSDLNNIRKTLLENNLPNPMSPLGASCLKHVTFRLEEIIAFTIYNAERAVVGLNRANGALDKSGPITEEERQFFISWYRELLPQVLSDLKILKQRFEELIHVHKEALVKDIDDPNMAKAIVDGLFNFKPLQTTGDANKQISDSKLGFGPKPKADLLQNKDVIQIRNKKKMKEWLLANHKGIMDEYAAQWSLKKEKQKNSPGLAGPALS